VADYAVSLCRASRSAPGVRLGASPRAAIWLIRSAQAYAVLSSRDFVAPGDVKAVAVGCLAHRILMDEGDEGIGWGRQAVEELLQVVPTPRP
jgi:MoxR-like ATPase